MISQLNTASTSNINRNASVKKAVRKEKTIIERLVTFLSVRNKCAKV